MGNKIICIFLISFLGLTTGAGCSTKTEDTAVTGNAVPGGDIIVAVSSGVSSIDPGYAWLETDIDVINHVFEGLVSLKNREMEVTPALAREWQVSGDGKRWTFFLHRGVKFHDGTEFNAHAVVFTFDRVLDENNPVYGAFGGRWSLMDYLMGGVIEDVAAVDDYTVEFRLKHRFGPFLQYLAFYPQFIVSPAAVKEHGKDFGKHPVGTGPFKLEAIQEDGGVVLAANDNYWGGMPAVNKLIYRIIPEAAGRVKALQAGQVDAVKALNPSQVGVLQEDPAVELLVEPGANLFYVALNCRKGALSDARVRRALNMAVDVEEVVRTVFKGAGIRAINALPPNVTGFDQSVGPYPCDPDGARELLEEAGYPGGLELKLDTFKYARPYVSRPVQAAEMIQADLEKVGVNVEVVVNEPGEHRELLQEGKHELVLTGWYGLPDPAYFLKTMALEAGHTEFSSMELGEMAEQAMAEDDADEQERMYRQLLSQVHEAAVLIPIAHNNYTAAVSRKVHGVVLDPVGTLSFRNALRAD